MSAIADQALDARLWRTSQLRPADWTAEVPASVVAEVASFVRANPGALKDLEKLPLFALAWPEVCSFGKSVSHVLRRGVGFLRLCLPADHGLDAAQARVLYLALGAALGEPLTQYGRLYAVKDRGADYKTSKAPVSMTKERTGFHTDSSARGVVPDFVGLLCERPAKEGGDSLVSNALGIREVLARRHPEVLRLLREDYVRDLVTPGVEADQCALVRNRFPVFAEDDTPAGWTFRYMRYWLERGQDLVGEPISPYVKAALDLLDELLASPEHKVGLRLGAGDMLWVNNRTLAHDRTSFVDDPAATRLLWRMWVSC